MKLLGGEWSRGDVIALAGLLVAVVTTALTVPEFRRDLHLDQTTQTPPPSPTVVHFKRTFNFTQQPFNITPSPSLHFGFSSLEHDQSLAGNSVKITKLRVVVDTENHSNIVCCDVWTFLGPAPFNFPVGATSVSQVGSYPWDINSPVAPTQLKLNLGHPGAETRTEIEFVINYDYSINTASVDPNMDFVLKSSTNPEMTLPSGLYAQVLVWAGLNNADIDVRKITLDVEGETVKLLPNE
jgi:hypothetical protein